MVMVRILPLNSPSLSRLPIFYLLLSLSISTTSTAADDQYYLKLPLLHKDPFPPNPIQSFSSDTHRLSSLFSALHRRSSPQLPVTSGASTGSGQYFVDLRIGNPPQRLLLVADTGSDLVWVTCSACRNCSSHPPNSAFLARHSSTFSPHHCFDSSCRLVPHPKHTLCNHTRLHSPCRYEYSYSDGSLTSGFFSRETTTFNTSSGSEVKHHRLAFGCSFQISGPSVSGPSFNGAHGVIGLGRGPISLASQLGRRYGNKFSYCLMDYTLSPPPTSFLLIGGAENVTALKTSYTPLQINALSPTFYYIGIESVFVDDIKLRISPSVWAIDKLGNGGSEEFYEEEFDPVRHFLEHIPYEEIEVAYFEEKAALRLAQLDKISERLSRHVMENHEEMVKGMHLVRELEKDLKVANVICMNGRRHLNSSRNEVSRDLIVTTNSRRKQALLDMLPVLAELRHALDMQVALEIHVEEGNFCKAFQVLSEYLQVLDSFSELSAIQEMSHGVEVWLGKTLQKLDSLLLGVCQDFKKESYITVVDAYALIGDVSGLAEKMQSFFMQEVLSVTHTVLKNIIQEDMESPDMQSSRFTYSDLCIRIPESKFRQCLLETLAVLFKLMCSYYAIMSFQPENKEDDGPLSESIDRSSILTSIEEPTTTTAPLSDATLTTGPMYIDYYDSEARDGGTETSSSESPWFQLRTDAATFVSQTLRRGRKNLWQLATSRVSVLLSSAAVCSTSIHQFLKNYEDLNIFILAGEAFCGVEAVEFRQKVKAICENYFAAFHRQNVYALKMVMEKEHWLIMPPDTIQVVSFAGLVGDGAALIAPSGNSSSGRVLHSNKSADSVETAAKKSGFSEWLKTGNPFLLKLSCTSKEVHDSLLQNGSASSGDPDGNKTSPSNKSSYPISGATHVNGNMDPEDENEDLLADFIDEDSQLPSRISKPRHSRNHYSHSNNDEMMQQTGSSLCLLRLMDKYARLMQKLEIINVEFFKGICQLFGIFFYFVFESFGQQSTNPTGKGLTAPLKYRLKTALSRITQDCDQWIKYQSTASPTSLNMPFTHMDVIPASPPSTNFSHLPTSFGLKERCASADTISLVTRLLHRSKAHLQSMLFQNNAAIVEDFYVHLVDSVPDLTEHIHRTTARLLLNINGYVDRIANAKWEVKEIGLEHNGYVDLLLGEFKHYRTRLAHGGIQKEVQNLLLEYGLENLAEILIEGLSRVKRCTDEGRALMSLDLQVLINGLNHFASINVKPKLQIVEAFVKAYYLPETEYVHWARAHPEYSKSQMVGLVNLVATMKGWKRKNRLEVIEKIESVSL